MFVPSRKLVFAFVTYLLTNAAAVAGARLGLHLSPAVSLELSQGIGTLAGFLTGVIVKEVPEIEKDLGL